MVNSADKTRGGKMVEPNKRILIKLSGEALAGRKTQGSTSPLSKDG